MEKMTENDFVQLICAMENDIADAIKFAEDKPEVASLVRAFLILCRSLTDKKVTDVVGRYLKCIASSPEEFQFDIVVLGACSGIGSRVGVMTVGVPKVEGNA